MGTVNNESEPYITVDSKSREINIPPELYNIGVVADDNSEEVIIKVPRFFDGIDFSTRNCTISYNNAAKERGIYFVKTMDVDLEYVCVHWMVDKYVTSKAGKIYFVLEFKKDIDERGLSYSWSTKPAELNVLKTLDDAIIIPDENLSLYENLKSTILKLQLKIDNVLHKFDLLDSLQMDLYVYKREVDDLKNEITSLKQRIVYIDPNEEGGTTS